MKNSNKKRGFTIVELIIVIAVIAILAAVLIPTFSSLINKSLVAADESLVRNLNEALAMDVTNPHNTMTDALKATKENGFDVSKINARASTDGQKHEILWDSRNDCFVYKKGDEINYIPKSNTKGDATDVELWHIANDGTLSDKYSNYLAAGTYAAPLDITTGLDVGEHKEVTEVNYTNPNGKQDVVIRTNGGELVVNAPDDTIRHFGNLAKADIQAVNDHCYYEHGIVGKLSVKSGAVIIDKGGVVAKVEVVGDTDGTNKLATLSKQNGGVVYEVPDRPILATEESALENQICAPATEEEKAAYGYIICCEEDLNNLKAMVEEGTYNQSINIIIASSFDVNNWTDSIGMEDKPFSGTIIGNGNKISGLKNCLIKYATGNVYVDGLELDVNINSSTESFVGGLIGVYDTKNVTNMSASVLIKNVTITGSIVAKDKAGGIIGSTYNSSVGNGNDIDFKLIDCTNSATVTAERAGGLIGTSCAYLRGDNDDNKYHNFKLTIDGCENTAAISSPTDSGNYRAGGFIGYCGGYGNYVFNSIKNSGTDCLIGISRIGSTARDVNNQGLIKDEYAIVLATDDYDYYYGSDADSITMRLWKWHSSLEQTQGSKDSSYKYVNPESMLRNDEWRFTIDGKHYKFASGAVHIRGVEDGVEQTSHVAINSDPNTYVIDGISVEYVENKSMDISGTVQNWTGWMAKIGAGTYKFDPTDYIPHNNRGSYTITDNNNGTWTVTAK